MEHKVLVTWNSHPRHERDLFQHVREMVNRASPLGLELQDAWYTLYGDAPEILLRFVPRKEQQETLDTILSSDDWRAILEDLREYITDYDQRIVKSTDRFQF